MTRAAELALELVLALALVVVLTRAHAWRRIGFRGLTEVRDLRFFWVPLFPVLPVLPVTLSAVPRTPLADLALVVVLAALIGFVEETAFRGLLLRWLASRGLWFSAVLSSVAFGAMHLVNLVLGAAPGVTVVQVGYAAALGFAFAAVVLRTGVLWPLVIIHALMDAAGFLTVDRAAPAGDVAADILLPAVYAVGFVVYGVLVLRAMNGTAATSVQNSEPAPGRIVAS